MIKSIKWNGRVEQAMRIGEPNGTYFKCSYAEVSDIGNPRVEKIVEIAQNIFDVYYVQPGHRVQCTKTRVINPIEVNYDLELDVQGNIIEQ